MPKYEYDEICGTSLVEPQQVYTAKGTLHYRDPELGFVKVPDVEVTITVHAMDYSQALQKAAYALTHLEVDHCSLHLTQALSKVDVS